MSGVNNLLSRLDKVKKTGKDSWRACCPAHGGRKQSLSIRDDGGKVLVRCFAEECDIFAVLGAVGLEMNDVQPRLQSEYKPQKRPFYAGDVLQISRDEILVAYLIVKKMLDNTVRFNDIQRLLTCASRLRHACEVANDGNGVPLMEIARNQKVVEGVINDE
jgi:hypothetical protein